MWRGACRRHFLAHRFIAGAHHVLHDLLGIAGEFAAQCGIHQLARSLAAGKAVSLTLSRAVPATACARCLPCSSPSWARPAAYRAPAQQCRPRPLPRDPIAAAAFPKGAGSRPESPSRTGLSVRAATRGQRLLAARKRRRKSAPLGDAVIWPIADFRISARCCSISFPCHRVREA